MVYTGYMKKLIKSEVAFAGDWLFGVDSVPCHFHFAGDDFHSTILSGTFERNISMEEF